MPTFFFMFILFFFCTFFLFPFSVKFNSPFTPHYYSLFFPFRCSSYYSLSGEAIPLTPEIITQIECLIEDCARKGERIIALAETPFTVPGDFVFNNDPPNFPVQASFVFFLFVLFNVILFVFLLRYMFI